MASSRGAAKSLIAFGIDPEACNLLQSSMQTDDRVRENFRTKHFALGTKSVMYDKNTASYSSLMTGWLAGEPTYSSGQVYEFYYDPTVNNSKKEVLLARKEAGYVVID